MFFSLLTTVFCAVPSQFFSDMDFKPNDSNLEQIKKYGFAIREATKNIEWMLYVISLPSMHPSNNPQRKYKLFKDFDDIVDITLQSTKVPNFAIFKEADPKHIPMRVLTYRYQTQGGSKHDIEILAISLQYTRVGKDNDNNVINLSELLLNKGKKSLQIAYETEPLQLKYKYQYDNYYFDMGTTLAYGGAPNALVKNDNKGISKMFVFYKVDQKDDKFKDSFIRIDKELVPYYKSVIGVNSWGKKESLATTANNGLDEPSESP